MADAVDIAGRTAPGPENQGREYEAPLGDLETGLAAIWEEVLKTASVSRNDNFFALGGHSFSAMRVTTLVSERLKIEISLRCLFEAPTLRELAAYITSITASPPSTDSSTAAAGWEEGVL